MHLASQGDPARVELSVEGYQFPSMEAHGERDWDANWLRIRGVIAESDGRSWSFNDPCLTTWEAEELGRWLREVVAGIVPPAPFGNGDDAELLVFLEPNIAFGLEAREGDLLQIRVHFSLESLPPWVLGAQRYDIFEYFVSLDVSDVELGRAAEDWALELGRFPKR